MDETESSKNKGPEIDLEYWCEELNLKVEDLTEIVQKVGPAIHDVRVHLAKNLLINSNVIY